MQIPLGLTFKNFDDRNGEAKAVVYEKLAKLENVCPRLTSCHVVIEQFQNPKHHHHTYSIHIVVTFPHHHEVVVTRDPDKGEIQEKLLTTQIREAFMAVRRQVQEILDKEQGRIKNHENGGEDEGLVEELEGAE
jgi:ribosome-associated translation inhibitor RaiA